MDVGIISTRYTRALFSLAKEQGVEDRVYEDIKMLADSFAAESTLKGVLENPIVPDADKIRVLTAAAGIEVCPLYTRFIQLVIKHKRESLLPFIAHNYIQMYRKDKKITRIKFSTAVPVDEATKEHLEKRLLQTTDGTIEFTGMLKPELIGGFLLRIGNYRIDASYRSQLRDIRKQLLVKK